jgi:ABC-type amino acid transport substrate-binding protein
MDSWMLKQVQHDEVVLFLLFHFSSLGYDLLMHLKETQMKPATTTIFFSILLSVLVSSLVLQFSLGHMMDKPKPVEVKKIETGYERVMRTKTLRCGYFAWAPYLIKDANTGKFSGAGHDIIEAMAALRLFRLAALSDGRYQS